MKEENIRPDLGGFRLDDPTKSDFKIIPMIDEDIELVQGLVRGLPNMRFFRHVKGVQSVKEGQPFGEKYFYKWFKKAAANLGFDEDLDMYGATKHTTLTHLRQFLKKGQIKEASYHRTNKALERYLQSDPNVKDIYEYAARKSEGKDRRKWGHEAGRLVKLRKKQKD